MKKIKTRKAAKSGTARSVKDLPVKALKNKTARGVKAGFVGFHIPTTTPPQSGKVDTHDLSVTKTMD